MSQGILARLRPLLDAVRSRWLRARRHLPLIVWRRERYRDELMLAYARGCRAGLQGARENYHRDVRQAWQNGWRACIAAGRSRIPAPPRLIS